jgi:integrase
MFSWAVENNLAVSDPCRDTKKMKLASTGFHTWTEAEIKTFRDFWPMGSKPRLAMSLMLFTGARVGDAVELGPHNIIKNIVTFTPLKRINPAASMSSCRCSTSSPRRSRPCRSSQAQQHSWRPSKAGRTPRRA